MEKDETLTDLVNKEEKKHFNFKNTLATAVTVLTLGIYHGNADAASNGKGNTNSTGSVSGYGVGTTPSRPGFVYDYGDPRFRRNDDLGQRDQLEQEYIDEKITNVNDYLKRAGQELEKKIPHFQEICTLKLWN